MIKRKANYFHLRPVQIKFISFQSASNKAKISFQSASIEAQVEEFH